MAQFFKTFSQGAGVVALGLLISDRFFNLAVVAGTSMQPALNNWSDEEYAKSMLSTLSIPPISVVFVNKWCMRDHKYHRGDAYSFRSPIDPGKKLVKRLIAIEGDVILRRSEADMAEEEIAHLLDLPPLPTAPKDRASRSVSMQQKELDAAGGYVMDMVTLKPGQGWMEGDNAATSIDSNLFGPIPLGLIEGKVTYVLWPFSHSGPIPERKTPVRHTIIESSTSTLAR